MISSTGYWILNDSQFKKEHVYCSKLSAKIVDYIKKLNINKVYDFGCGPGKYVEHLRRNNIESYGFDGNPVTSNFLNCRVQDLTDYFLEPPVDFLMCLEVCEHVPKEYEETLLQTIDRHLNPGGTLLLSWAVIGQDGLGHVNCQNNDYVIETLQSMGYTFNKQDTKIFRNVDFSEATWFEHTIFVFNKLR